MSEESEQVSLYVKVECNAYSSYRNPQGIYQVNVNKQSSITKCASAAMQIVRESASFIDENINKLTMKTFSIEGSEICVPYDKDDEHSDIRGIFKGRVRNYPSTISLSS